MFTALFHNTSALSLTLPNWYSAPASIWSRSALPLPFHLLAVAREIDRKPLKSPILPVSPRKKTRLRLRSPPVSENLPPATSLGPQVLRPILPPEAPMCGASVSVAPWVTKISHRFSLSLYSWGKTEKLPESFTGAPLMVKPIWSLLKPRTRRLPPKRPVASKLDAFTPGKSDKFWYGLLVGRIFSICALVTVLLALGVSSSTSKPVPSLSPSPVTVILPISEVCCAWAAHAREAMAIAMAESWNDFMVRAFLWESMVVEQGRKN